MKYCQINKNRIPLIVHRFPLNINITSDDVLSYIRHCSDNMDTAYMKNLKVLRNRPRPYQHHIHILQSPRHIQGYCSNRNYIVMTYLFHLLIICCLAA